MSREIPERDWRHFREIRVAALERLCEEILDEVEELTAKSSLTWHERYLAVFKRIQERDDDIARAFNNNARSRAISHLIAMVQMKLITSDELDGFSEETRDLVEQHMAGFE